MKGEKRYARFSFFFFYDCQHRSTRPHVRSCVCFSDIMCVLLTRPQRSSSDGANSLNIFRKSSRPGTTTKLFESSPSCSQSVPTNFSQVFSLITILFCLQFYFQISFHLQRSSGDSSSPCDSANPNCIPLHKHMICFLIIHRLVQWKSSSILR